MEKKGSLLCFWGMHEDVIDGLLCVSEDSYSLSSVSELSRFDDPFAYISSHCLYDLLPVEACQMIGFRQFLVRIPLIL